MTNDPSTIVRAGYDKVAERHLEWKRSIAGNPSQRFLEELANRLPENVNVLDLGCGAGISSTK